MKDITERAPIQMDTDHAVLIKTSYGDPKETSMTSKSTILFLAIFVALIFNLFYLVPWAFVEGKFDITNVGIAVLFFGLFYAILRGKDFFKIFNPITYLILIYFLLIGTHVGIASIYYDQSILNGIIAVKKQFLYLSLPLFLLLLDDIDKIVSFLNLLTLMALAIIVLAVVNYIGITVFYHYKAEWESIRTGIRRVYIPGTPIIHLALIWQFCQWVRGKRNKLLPALLTLLLLSGLFFHQSRAPIFGFICAVITIFAFTRSYKQIFILMVAGILSVLILSATMKENIILSVFTNTVDEVGEGSGTWGARLEQMQIDFREFSKHPIFGSGLIAIRVSEYGKTSRERSQMGAKAHIADLGYTHWIKMFGLIGGVWLIIFLGILWKKGIHAFHFTSKCEQVLALFGLGYLAFVTISSITLAHFLNEERILLLCLVISIIQGLSKKREYEPDLYHLQSEVTEKRETL